MPELPEVETIRRGLEEHIVGRKILSVDVRLKKIFEGNVDSLVGGKFKSIRRFGKALVLDLDNGSSIAVHVKMTGQLIYRAVEKNDLPHKFTHVIIHLDKGVLYYNDMRQFGWLKVVKTLDVENLTFVKNLGPEMLKDLTLEKFQKILKEKKTNIKTLLMDQKIMAGVGNIYANDALFLAKINPKRTAGSLTTGEQEKLFNALEDVLNLGIKHGGSSENTYLNADGEQGSYQKYSPIYGKTGDPCAVCGTKIIRITIGGRGTFFCPSCQN